MAVVASLAALQVPPTPGDEEYATVYLEIDERYQGELTSPVLKVGDATYSLAEIWPDLRAGAKLCITGVEGQPDDLLQVSFVVNGTRSATSILLGAK